MKKDKQKKLFPEIEKKGNEFESLIPTRDYSDIDSGTIEIEGEEEDSSYFKNILKELFNPKNISTKTEYLNVNENFVGTKLTFLARYGNIPYLEEFVNVFETKRVSLERKGRKEIIMALEKREEEIQRQKENRLKGLLGI